MIRSCHQTLWRDLPILLVVVLYVAVAILVAVQFDIQHQFRLLMYPAPVVEALLVISGLYLVMAFIAMMIRRELSPIGQMLVTARPWVKNLPELLGHILTLVAIMFFLSSFTSIKSMIPLSRPYGLDLIFAEIDQFLHDAVEPWRITHGLFSGASNAPSTRLQDVTTERTGEMTLSMTAMGRFRYLANRSPWQFRRRLVQRFGGLQTFSCKGLAT